ncbi:MAG: hypothetical protein AAGG99_03255 [Pseudomonadota bacterium]
MQDHDPGYDARAERLDREASGAGAGTSQPLSGHPARDDDDAPALMPSEEQLVARLLAGEIADLNGGTVRAALLQRIILKIDQEGVPGSALRIRRALVDGCLDLEGCDVPRALLFAGVRFRGLKQRGAIILRDAQCRRVSLQNCAIDGAIVADRAHITNGLFFGGGELTGALKLRGAHIGGACAIEGTRLGDGQSSVLANGLAISGPVVLRRARCSGQIALARSRLGGGLNGEGLKLQTPAGEIGLVLDSADLDGDLTLSNASISGGISVVNAAVRGEVLARHLRIAEAGIDGAGLSITQRLVLDDGRIAGAVVLDGSHITTGVSAAGLELDGGDVALSAMNARWGGVADLRALKAVGAVSMARADIVGGLDFSDARLFGSGRALDLDGVTSRAGLSLRDVTLVGQATLASARFGDTAHFTGLTAKVERGVAVDATGLRMARDCLMNDAFNTIGAVVLDGAEIGGTLDLTASRIKSVAIARGVSDRTSARGPAHTASVVEFHETAQPHDETALSCVGAEIGCLRLPARAEQRPRGIVDVSRATARTLEDHAACWPLPGARSFTLDGRDIDHLVLNGFVYGHIANPSGRAGTAETPTPARRGNGVGLLQSRAGDGGVGRARLRWLAGQSASDTGAQFKPQPYVQLSTQLAAQGHSDAARDVMIAAERGMRRTATATRADRWQNRLRDWLALYGYNPWRSVVWMVAAIVLFAVLFGWAATLCSESGCRDETLLVATAQDRYSPTGLGRGYPDFNALAYSLDAFFPLLNLGYDDHWRFNPRFGAIATVPVPSTSALLTLLAGGEPESLLVDVTISLGMILAALVMLERFLGVILTAIAVTAFTGLMSPRRQ